MKYYAHSVIATLLFFCLSIAAPAQKQYVLNSPDHKLEVRISIDKTISWQAFHGGDEMIAPSTLSISLSDGKVWGINPNLKKSHTHKAVQRIPTQIYKKKLIEAEYNEIVFEFKDGFDLRFRAYNEGIAYRFVPKMKGPFIIENEEASFNFPSDSYAFIPYVRDVKETLEEQFYNSFENTYTHVRLSEWDRKRLAFMPLLIEAVNNKKICITEADLLDYPGMYLYPGDKSHSLKGVFAPYPKEIKQGGHNRLQGEVQSRENYIARYDGAYSPQSELPWRVVIISENDQDLANSDLVYLLASPDLSFESNKPSVSESWIKPGKVAWDWWNDWNLYNVDFKTGINNDTYKYYIDFASKHGIEYVILDEGWSVNLAADLYQVVPEIDLPLLVDYAKQRNVDLILWAGYYAFNKDMEGICRHYANMGIKGFKIDFMDRDDQPMVRFHYDAAQITYKYKLLADFHGTYKPVGLQRTFPNVINFEGVNGLEQMKWADVQTDQVTYDVTFPFIRMVAGPVDYTQGAMRNATRQNYRPIYNEAMSQGTRCRQLAEYIVFESPLMMLCDNPSNYMAEPECLEFISAVPTVWDNTIALNGRVGEYITIAREKDGQWYVGSLTNWEPRKLELDLSFLGEGNFVATMFKDGVNANRVARDYKKEEIVIPADGKLTVDLASGGGCVMIISRK